MKTGITIAAVLLFVIVLEMVRELHSFRITRYHIASGKLKGTGKGRRILFLSDLHCQVYGENNGRLFEAVCRERPELILIGGDMLIGKNGYDYRTALDFVKQLSSVCPVYYANGNHEQRMKEQPEKYRQSYQEYKKELLNSGIHFLENASEQFLLGACSVRLTGLEIPEKGYSRFHGTGPSEEEMRTCIGCCPETEYQILLAHNPSYMEAYLAWGADLILSGHLHGGLVRVPGLGGMISPGFGLFPKYSGGCYRQGEQTVIVSKGLGMHTIPVRLLNPAEVVVVELSEGCEKDKNFV